MGSVAISEMMIEDSIEFKTMFRMSAEDFEFVLKHIDDFISTQEISSGQRWDIQFI